MGLFQHPHLIRGIVHTSKGSFAINRGLVDVPDEVGESYGWLRLELDDAKRAAPVPSAGALIRGGARPVEL